MLGTEASIEGCREKDKKKSGCSKESRYGNLRKKAPETFKGKTLGRPHLEGREGEEGMKTGRLSSHLILLLDINCVST